MFKLDWFEKLTSDTFSTAIFMMYSNTFTAYCVGKIPINLMPEVRDEYPVLRVTDVINPSHT